LIDKVIGKPNHSQRIDHQPKTLVMFNDITKPPPPLPTTQSSEIKPGLSIVLPLSRRGHGPGLIVLVPDTDQSLAIIDGVPSQLIKWAEEGYTVVEIQRRALVTGAREVLTEATQALDSCEKCDSKDKIGLIGNKPLSSIHVCFSECLSIHSL
jgi:carboxymethylenebutenolidase